MKVKATKDLRLDTMGIDHPVLRDGADHYIDEMTDDELKTVLKILSQAIRILLAQKRR